MKAIDLGLSIKWANQNLGASSPTEAGERYAWAELAPKKEYKWENYKDWVASGLYGPYKESHFCRKIEKIQSADDAITHRYGKPWRIPTADEFKELLQNCRWVKTTENGMNGYRVYGKNNNSIFLPAGEVHSGLVHYWSASRMVKNPQYAKILDLCNREPRIEYRSRCYGFYLRGIYDEQLI